MKKLFKTIRYYNVHCDLCGKKMNMITQISVMKEKAIEMKKAIDNQMTWESIVRRIEDLV